MVARIAPDGTRLREDIALSWRRSMFGGLDPESDIDNLPTADVDAHSRLVEAARPVLDDMAAELAGSEFGVLLADGDARIVDRRADVQLADALDRVSAVPGTRYDEETTGTNSVATAFELRRGVEVNGAEHFLEALKPFCCYGHPIRHPITERLEGVLDISGPADKANPLLRPFLLRSVRQIEQRLLASARRPHQQLLSAFQIAARHRSTAVIAVGDDLVLANSTAMDLLHSADHAMLGQLAADTTRELDQRLALELSSGVTVQARMERVRGVKSGAVFELTRVGPRRIAPWDVAAAPDHGLLPATVATQLNELRGQRAAILISGPSGSGRSWLAQQLTAGQSATTMDALDAATATEEWTRRLEQGVAGSVGPLVVEDMHLLPAGLATRLCRTFADGDPWMLLTSCPSDELTGPHAALAGQCLIHIDIPALRSRAAEIPAIATRLLALRHSDNDVRLTKQTLEVLAARDWPGNLRELAAVLRYVVEHQSVGDILPAHLPPAYRTAPTRRRLTQMERAEYDAIVSALHATGGNKRRAAQRLGIARSTLYERMHGLHITL